jgi:spermidine synthase
LSKARHKTQSQNTSVDTAPIKASDNGRRALLVGGVVQSVHPEDASSGYWIEMLPDRTPVSALLLGLGGGTVARLLERRFDPIAITGVDNSDEMLAAATDFGPPLDKTRLVQADATDFIYRNSSHYGFIAVDLYRADHMDRGVLAPPFLRALTASLKPGGTVAFNLFQDHCLDDCLVRLERVFKRIRLTKIGRNAVFHGRLRRPHP